MPSDFNNDNVEVGRDLLQAAGSVYIGSTHVAGGGPISINNLQVERRWTRPQPPPLLRATIPRKNALAEASRLLQERGQLAVSGRTASMALRGMPGIGKTTLARMLALELEPLYPDGVLWQELGPDYLSEDKVQPLLDQWAAIALAIPLDARASVHFESGAVRALLGEHPRLLVVLDNVWSFSAIRPLLEALPPQAHLLITTRSAAVARGLGHEPYELHELTPEEARELMALRLNLKEIPREAEWCDKLAAGLGFHTLALDVALGIIRHEGNEPAEWRTSAERIVEYVRAGEGFEDLHLKEEDRERNVERVLSYSYRRMDETAQRYFRLLGAFSPDSDFDTNAVAGLWECDFSKAKKQLDDFVDAALLSRVKGGRWTQHGVLRGYALALLRRDGSQEKAAARHAQIYDEAMREADDAQRFALMLPAIPQLRHAYAWAVQNDLPQALRFINNCANLQAAFGLAQENLTWCEQALLAATKRGTPMNVAHAQGSLANALQQVAQLPRQNRASLLQQALDAYDEALRFFTSDFSPLNYATTQNNRAILLLELASLPGQNRALLLQQALDAYAEALRFRTPGSSPLAYAQTQNNRANLLRELASLPGQNRALFLQQALDAYDEALRFFPPDSSPLAYATTQNNRANLLLELASLPGQNRALLLQQALDAYAEALRFRTPDSSPLAYATTQNNRANLLLELASLPGQNRALLLQQALEAYTEALRFRTPDSSPLAHATTQNNRANLLRELASLDSENRLDRLAEALQSVWIAFTLFTSLQHQQYQDIAVGHLQHLSMVCGDDFDTLWLQLHVGPPPSWLTPEGIIQTMKEKYAPAIIAAPDPQALAVLWQQVPKELESHLLTALEDVAAHATEQGETQFADLLREKIETLRHLQETE
jgi:hypothetical protein